MKTSNWIKSPLYDGSFILAPPFICLLIIAIFPNYFIEGQITEWTWFILVVCIDVGHVYSTIYRTYLDKEALRNYKVLLYLSPLILYVFGVMLHSVQALLFWKVLAYFAVFHFVRQQYGFMRLYARTDPETKWQKLDTVVIYSATLYPIIYWHLKGPQLFNWFVENDFTYLNQPEIIPFLKGIYIFLLGAYFIKELVFYIKTKSINRPKNILIIGTIISWYMGIIYFKGDLTFTLLNVASHGIPYFALVWAYGNKAKQSPSSALTKLFKPQYIIVFLFIILGLAYVEEFLWDGFIWREHFDVFPNAIQLPDISSNEILMSLFVPLLALPQILHYFIDGFIWKIKSDKSGWLNYFSKSN